MNFHPWITTELLIVCYFIVEYLVHGNIIGKTQDPHLGFVGLLNGQVFFTACIFGTISWFITSRFFIGFANLIAYIVGYVYKHWEYLEGDELSFNKATLFMIQLQVWLGIVSISMTV